MKTTKPKPKHTHTFVRKDKSNRFLLKQKKKLAKRLAAITWYGDTFYFVAFFYLFPFSCFVSTTPVCCLSVLMPEQNHSILSLSLGCFVDMNSCAFCFSHDQFCVFAMKRREEEEEEENRLLHLKLKRLLEQSHFFVINTNTNECVWTNDNDNSNTNTNIEITNKKEKEEILSNAKHTNIQIVHPNTIYLCSSYTMLHSQYSISFLRFRHTHTHV